MTDYLRPGVFVEEKLDPLSENPLGVPGVPVAAFAGAHNRGPDTPVLIKSWNEFVRKFGGFDKLPFDSYLPFGVYSYFNNGGSACWVCRVENTDAAVATLEIDDKTPVTPETIFTAKATSPGEWGNEVYVEIAASGSTDRFDINVYVGGTGTGNVVERFVDLSADPTDRRYAVSAVNSPLGGSQYIELTNEKEAIGWTYESGVDNPAALTPTALTGGDDGSTAPDLGAQVTARFDSVDGLLNINLPGVSDAAVINEVIDWAEGRGDVFVIADGPKPPSGKQTSAQVASTYLNLATGGSSYAISSYVAVYGPWILAQDPASTISGATRWLPPGGSVLGYYAKNDRERGVHKTPAGIHANIHGAIDLEARFTHSELDQLNQAGINAIKVVPGYGFCIFGGRTLHPGWPDRYVSVRRILQNLRHDFIELTRFAIFEPNGPVLWEQITAVLTNFLIQQMQEGVLQGATTGQSFAVVCNETNNPSVTAEAGTVNVDVAVALLSPAEFIIITISQLHGSAGIGPAGSSSGI